MDPEQAIYFELIERRLQLVQALVAELSESKSAMAALDLRALEKRTLEQEGICAELAFVAGELASLQRVGNPGPDEFRQAGLSIEGASAVAQQELLHAGRVHGALVRRSRRSIDVLMNVLSTCTAEYSNWSGAYAAARYF